MGSRTTDRSRARPVPVAVDAQDLKAHFASIVEFTSDAVIGVTLDGIILSWNTAAERIFEYTAEEIIGQHVRKLFPFHLYEEQTCLIGRIRKGELVRHYETTRLTKSGKLLDISLTLSPIYNGLRQLIGISNIARDITIERAHERELRLLSERHHLAAEAGGIGFWSFEPGTLQLEWNEQHKLLFGLQPDSPNPSLNDFLHFVHPEDEPLVRKAFDELLGGKPEIAVDCRIIRADASLAWIATRGKLQPPSESQSGFVLGISIDLTQRRSVEQALRLANASLEEFAYAAAHDLQEPLRNISLSLQELEMLEGVSADERKQMLNLAISNANRMQTVIRDLLAFSRAVEASPGVMEKINANSVAEEAIENLSRLIHEHGGLIEVQPALPTVSMHRAHLLQLFQNLLGNSLKYGRAGVAPVVRVSCNREISHVVFSVSDNGIGIAPQYHKRVFGIFKRLDRSQPGNGIGLSVCKRIVEHYGGNIRVDSIPGHGATFSFSIPCAAKSPNSP